MSNDSARSERSEGSPLIPPPDFIAALNEQREGPPLTALDPLAMLIWHTITRPPDPGDMVRVTGC